jgi:4-amino-4-deoxy-L-arabinose transferase-like glycosyltransferase
MNKKFYIWLGIIALIGTGVRLGAGFELAFFRDGFNSVMQPPSATDMATYWEISGLITSGSFSGEFYYQPFYSAVFLPVIRWLLGDTIYAVIVVQALLGGAVVYLVGLCGRRLWSPGAGLIGAAVIALSRVLVLHTPFLLIEVLQSFWITLILFLALRGAMRREPVDWALCALALGCSILTRGNGWLFLPGLLVAAVWSLRLKAQPLHRNIINGFLTVFVFIALVILPQLPFIIHNSRVLGKLSGPSTAAGAVLALGNTPEAPPGGRTPGLPAGPMEYPPTFHSWMAQQNETSVPANIWRWFCEEPGAYLELTFRKLLLFWDYREIPNNVSIVVETERSGFLSCASVIPTGLILFMALGGMAGSIISWFYRPRRWLLLLPLFMVAAYWGATAMFYMLSRFRVPILPVLGVFAGIFPIWFMELRKQKSQDAYMYGGLVLVFGVFIAFTAYDFYRYKMEPAVMRSVRPNGVHVRMIDGSMMYLDNGPETFGDWRPVQLFPGVRIVKKFAVKPDPAFSRSELELSLGSEYTGTIVLSVNGERYDFVFPQPGWTTHRIPMANPSDTVEIIMQTPREGVFSSVDFQRNYGRTLFDGKPLDGELVCRLFQSMDKPLPELKPDDAETSDEAKKETEQPVQPSSEPLGTANA